jgi:phage tail-like protein
MPTPLVQPAPSFNFMISMWDVQGPTVFGIDTANPAVAAAGALLNLGAQFLLGGFAECEGLNAELEIETYQEGGRNASPHRFFKTTRYGNLTLQRGTTFNTDIWDWHHQVATAQATKRIRKSGIVVLFDRGGPNLLGADLPGLDRLPVATWFFHNALPERLQGPRLNAKSNELAIERLELSHEGVERVSLALIPGLGDLAGAFGGAVGALGGAVAAGGAALL